MSRREELAAPAKGKSAPDKRIPLNLLCGLPDDGKANLRALDNGRRLDIRLPGTLGIAPVLPPERFAVTSLYLAPGGTSAVEVGPGPLLNLVSDYDLCAKTLELIRQVAAHVPRPCFNHPDAVARTTRDTVAIQLAGTPGLDVPKTIRIAALAPEQLAGAVEAAGMNFPVLVRVVGAHGGADLVRIDNPQASGEIRNLPVDAREFYVTEFRNCASPDGRFRKTRIVVVGDKIFMRHCIIGGSWNVAVESRMPEARDEEKKLLATFRPRTEYQLRPLFQEIARRLDLDFFGVDCHIGEDGRITLFEANAAMFILGNVDPSPNMWDEPIANIKAALFDLLSSPQRWRDYPRYLARTQGTEPGARVRV